MNNGLYPTEVISFERADGRTASVATNGMRHVTQEVETKEHATLTAAICYLESLGYSSRIDSFLVY